MKKAYRAGIKAGNEYMEQDMKEKLLEKIRQRKLNVGVVGLGYVGLPLAVEKAKAGFNTTGFDVQEEKVRLVNAGHNYIGDVVDSELEGLVRLFCCIFP